MTDKPRKIVFCHPDNFEIVNKAVMALNYGDILVQKNPNIRVGEAYVIDGDVLD